MLGTTGQRTRGPWRLYATLIKKVHGSFSLGQLVVKKHRVTKIGVFRSVISKKYLVNSSISFSLRHPCLSTGLYFTIMKRQDRFLMNILLHFCDLFYQGQLFWYPLPCSRVELNKICYWTTHILGCLRQDPVLNASYLPLDQARRLQHNGRKTPFHEIL